MLYAGYFNANKRAYVAFTGFADNLILQQNTQGFGMCTFDEVAVLSQNELNLSIAYSTASNESFNSRRQWCLMKRKIPQSY